MSPGALVSAALTSLWLGALLVLAGRLALVALPRLGPDVRYRLWSLLLLLTAAVPLAGLLPTRPVTLDAPPVLEAIAEGGAAPVGSQSFAQPVSAVVPVPGATASTGPLPSGSVGLGVPPRVLDWLLVLWFTGSLASGAVLLLQLLALRRLKGRAVEARGRVRTEFDAARTRLQLRRGCRILLSDEVTLPVACGYLHPAVILPPRMVARLEPSELRYLLLHELAHLRRRDDWGLLLQRALLAGGWWNPALWWLNGQLESDREQACDLLAAAGARRAYARALVHVAELLIRPPRGALAPGALRGGLAARIESLCSTGEQCHSTRARRTAAVTATLVLLLGAWIRPPALVPGNEPSQSPADLRISDQTVAARLDSVFSRFADSGFSGTILVARGDRVLLERGYGMADRELGIPASASTRYSAAGMTKMFTAGAVLLLAREGRLRLSDSLARWVGPLPPAKAGVTLHQLLTHTDGLTRQSAPVYRRTADDFVQAVAGTASSFKPGAGYRYNDFGHSLLGVVIERASGMRLEEYLRLHLLQPAGLTATGFESDGGAIAVEYSGPAGDLHPIPSRAYVWGRRGSLGLVTTAGDLYRWSRAVADPAVIPEPVYRQMQTTYGPTDWGAEQGYGWDLVRRKGGRPLWRRVAGTPGFEGELLHDPESDWTAVILVNSRLGWRYRVWREIERALEPLPSS